MIHLQFLHSGSLILPLLFFTAKPYNSEFYFDTPNPVRILKGNTYSYNLQWTQREPQATDRIIGYWLNVRKVKSSRLCTHMWKQLGGADTLKS